MDLKWIALAIVIVGTAAVALALQKRKISAHVTARRGEPGSPHHPQHQTAPSYNAQPVRVPQQPRALRFASGEFAGKINEWEESHTTEENKYAGSTFWWVGRTDAWTRIERDANLTKIESLPEDGDLVVMVWEIPGLTCETPGSKIGSSTLIRDAEHAGKLVTVGKFSFPKGLRLSEHGFTR